MHTEEKCHPGWVKIIILEGIVAAFLIGLWFAKVRYEEPRETIYVGTMNQTITMPFDEISEVTIYNQDKWITNDHNEPIGVTILINEPGDIENIVWEANLYPTTGATTINTGDIGGQLETGHTYEIRTYADADLYQNLSFRLYGEIKSYGPLYLILTLYVLAAVAMIWILLAVVRTSGSSRRRVWGACFTILCILGLGAMLVAPNLNIPDEDTHFAKAYQMSSRLVNSHDLANNNRIYVDQQQLRDQFLTLSPYDFWFGQQAEPDTDIYLSTYIYQDGYPSYTQVMSLAAISLARVVNLPWQCVLLSGRIANLLLYAALAAAAAACCPSLRKTILATAMFPTSVWLAASYSYDGLQIGTILLFTGLCVQARADERDLRWREIILLAVVAMLMTPIKVVYGVLLLLLLLIPGKQFKIPFGRKMGALVVWGGAVFLTLALQWNSIHLWLFTNSMDERGIQSEMVPIQEHFYASLDESLDIAVAEGDRIDAPNWVGEEIQYTNSGTAYVNYSASYALRHPVYTLEVLFQTGITNIDNYVWEIVDRSRWYSKTLCIIILGCWARIVIGEVQDERFRRPRVRVFAGILFLITLMCIIGSMLVAYTTVPAEGVGVIRGVQGRYFVPLLPLLALVFAGRDPIGENYETVLLRTEMLMVLIGIAMHL